MVTRREKENALSRLNSIREQIAGLSDENAAIGESGSAQELTDAHFHLTNARQNVELLSVEDEEQADLSDIFDG